MKSFYYRAVANGLWDQMRVLLVEKAVLTPDGNQNQAMELSIHRARRRCMVRMNVELMGGKTKGRKRHIVTDTMGNLLAVDIHAANIHDTVGGVPVYDQAITAYPSIVGMCGDLGYRGTFVSHVAQTGRKCDITDRTKPKEWKITPKRWIVERTLAWASHSRRLAKNYEISLKSEAAWFVISHCHSILRRY